MGDATINADQRDVLRQALMFELGAAGDISLFVDRGDFDQAVEYSARYQYVLRLLDDLGWNPDDQRRSYELTMEPAGLAAAARFQLQQAEDELEDESGLSSSRFVQRLVTGVLDPDEEEARSIVEEDERVCAVCLSILDQLGEGVPA